MKFTDGYWRKRDGVAALHPAHVHDVEPGCGVADRVRVDP